MKTKTFSLCMLIIVLLLCTTVAAVDHKDQKLNDSNLTEINDNINTSEITKDTSDVDVSNNVTTVKLSEKSKDNIKKSAKIDNADETSSSDKVKSNVTKNKSSQKTYTKTNNKKTTQKSYTKKYSNTKKTQKTVKSSSYAKQQAIIAQERARKLENEKIANNTKKVLKNAGTNSSKNATYSISGTVTQVYNNTTGKYAGGEEDGYVTEGAEVVIYDSYGVKVAQTKSDKSGNYKVDNLTKNNYTVTFSYGTYALGNESVTITNKSKTDINYTFIPDIAIISYSGATSTDGQKEKVEALKSISDRVYFLESYNIIEGYDNSDQWMLDYTNFILVDMYSEGNGFGIDVRLIGESPASQNNMIAYTFGIYSEQLFQGNLRSWGFVGGDPYSLENTYIGSYWQAERITDNETVQTNMKNFYKYIEYLLGDSDVDPTKKNGSPILERTDWGIYYPGHKSFTLTPTQQEINSWILSNPGYNDDGAGSLNWMTQNLTAWNAKNNDPKTIFNEFETWYDKNVKINGSFVVITSYYPGGDVIDAMIKEYEKQGRAAINLYQKSTTPSISEFLQNLTVGDMALKHGVSAVSSLYSFSMDYINMGTEIPINTFKNTNVSILRALDAIDITSYQSKYGPQAEWTMGVTVPQFEGVFGAIPVSYLDEEGNEIIIQSGLEKHVNITNGWAKLKDMENKDKKIAIILYSYPPGKADVGASYLDVFESVREMLIQMKENGYDIGYESVDDIPSTDELTTLILELSNKGTHAIGLLEQYVEKYRDELEANHQIISQEQYQKWFNELPENLQESMIENWGEGFETSAMVYKNTSLIVPGMHIGNIFISVQPARGWDEVADYHSDTLSPPPPYLAYYKYLNEIWDVDAIVHMGTHGTLEWLPGHTLGMQETDWPFQLTNVPIIYPYIVSNPGEGMTAKERSFAQVITHMTPVTVDSSLYGDYVKLEDSMSRYTEIRKLNSTGTDVYKSEILNISSELGYRPMEEDETFDEYVEFLHAQIESMETDKITLGNHVLGHIWNDTEMVEGVKTIAASRTYILQNLMELRYPGFIGQDYYTLIKDRSFEPYKDDLNNMLTNIISLLVDGNSIDEVAETYMQNNESALYQDITDVYNIIEGIKDNKEWASIFTALDGGYVEPGLSADPSYSDVLPTGRSLYASDTTKMPSRNAWEMAKNAVDIMIRNYYENNAGSWPQLNAIVIWGTEVLRTEGVSLAEFLYFMGVEPTWDHNGKYKDLKVIPLENLTLKLSDGSIINRPRLDVFTTIVSSNPQWIKMLNDAVKLVYDLNESSTGKNIENYVIKHVNEYIEAYNKTEGALDRVFGLRGAILEGTGVSDLAPSVTNWQDSENGISNELSSVYMSRISNAWNVNDNGKIEVTNNTDQFTYLLSHLTLLTQNLDSTWRVTDSDDYADWFGGLLNAANTLGAKVNTQLLDIRDKNNIISSTLVEEIQKEIRDTLLNPTYIDSQINGASGWNAMAAKLQNAMEIMFTTQGYAEDRHGNAVEVNRTGNNAGALGSGLITQIGKMLVSDKLNVNKDYKAFAFQSMAGWLLTTDMNGFWESNQALREQLSNKYIQSAVQYGIACCHHTCKNVVFNKWVVKTSTVPNEMKQQFSDMMAASTSFKGSLLDPNDLPYTNTLVEDDYSGEIDLTSTVTEIGIDASAVDTGVSGNPNANANGQSAGSGSVANLVGPGNADTQNTNGTNGTATDGNGNEGSGSQSNGNGENTGNSDSGDSGANSGSGTSGSGTSSNNYGDGVSVGTNGGAGDSKTNSTAEGSGSSVGDVSSAEAASNAQAANAEASAGSKSDDGEASAASAGSAMKSVFEVTKKKLSKSAPQDSEISAAYLVGVVLVGLLFFAGFEGRNPRERKR